MKGNYINKILKQGDNMELTKTKGLELSRSGINSYHLAAV